MALALTEQENDGTTATFFVAQEVDCYPNQGVVRVVLYGYASQAAFAAGKMPMPEATLGPVTLPYQGQAATAVAPALVGLGISITDPNNPPMPTLAQIYAALLQLPQFAGATLV